MRPKTEALYILQLSPVDDAREQASTEGFAVATSQEGRHHAVRVSGSGMVVLSAKPHHPVVTPSFPKVGAAVPLTCNLK